METTTTIMERKIPSGAFIGADNGLELVEKGIRDAIAGSEGIVRDMCAHIAGSGGKRIRPQLVLHCGLAFSLVNKSMIQAAVAAELIHMASLVHDDIIDRSDLRRGSPSVNKLWGNHAAVLCGDWLFAKAFGILASIGVGPCMGYMVDAIQAMCHGEVLQAMNIGNVEIDANTYFSQISKKTAKLLEGCCKCGASTGGGNTAEIRALGGFGLNIGVSFQIIDDILDFRGNSGTMGKPKGEDLGRGVVTLPVIFLLQDGKYGPDARKLLAGGIGDGEFQTILQMLETSGAIEKAYLVAVAYIESAQACLDLLPDSQSKIILYEIASSLMKRDK